MTAECLTLTVLAVVNMSAHDSAHIQVDVQVISDAYYIYIEIKH